MSYAMVISFGSLVVCFLIRMPIAIGMVISPTLYLVIKDMGLSMVAEIFISKACNNFIFLAASLFIFVANVASSNKATDKIFDFFKIPVGWWRDGLRHVNVITSLISSGMIDSAVVGASGLGIMGIEAMRKEGYNDGSNAVITTGPAVIGPIFPPNIPPAIYGAAAGASIENLFLTGTVPGITLTLVLCIYVCYIMNKRNYPSGGKYVGMEFVRMMVSAISALLTPVILLMGIYTGIVTATEAGAVAALYVLPISISTYRSVTLPEFIQVPKNTVKSMKQVGTMLDIAYVFSYVIVVENPPSLAGNLILSFAATKVTSLVFINVILFILGMLLGSAALQLVLLPILYSITQSLGIDVAHFGVVFMPSTMIGLRTPPFSMFLFIVTGISGEEMNVITEEVMPMVPAMILVLVLVTLAPNVIMWLSRLFRR